MYESGTRLPPRARVIDFVSRLEMSEPTRRLSSLASLPVFWDRVDAVERQSDHGEQFVYDLTVPGTNTFLLGEGGIVGHNTTLLNALLAELPGRTVIIEETAELQIQEIPFAVALEGRPPNVEGAGEITLRPLVKTGLRMRPRRIVIGESRGPEALDLLQAMNTGHPGSLTTAHANGPRDGLERLVTMAAEAGERLPESTLRRMVAQAISLVVYLEADAHGQRAVQEIWELTGMEGDRFLGHALFERRDGRLHRSNLPSRWTAEPRRNGLAREAPHAGW
jgi:pilus assembly protein CpaF